MVSMESPSPYPTTIFPWHCLVCLALMTTLHAVVHWGHRILSPISIFTLHVEGSKPKNLVLWPISSKYSISTRLLILHSFIWTVRTWHRTGHRKGSHTIFSVIQSFITVEERDEKQKQNINPLQSEGRKSRCLAQDFLGWGWGYSHLRAKKPSDRWEIQFVSEPMPSLT